MLYALKIWNRSLEEAILEEYGIRNMTNFNRALQRFKIGILMGSFNPKLKKYELKIHRGVMS